MPKHDRITYIYSVPLDQLANLLDDAEDQPGTEVFGVHPDGSRWTVLTRGGIMGTWVAVGRAERPTVDYTRITNFPVEVLTR
jgi:hypothetical protein